MALVKRDCQASVALVQQKNVEKDKKSNVKVLDEETYVQVWRILEPLIMLEVWSVLIEQKRLP